MKQTIRDIIGSGLNQSADSRAVALTGLSSCLQDAGPIVIWLHGMAGAGKGSLLDEFALNTAGTRVVRIDCRTIEPTPAGLLTTLGDFGLQARAVLVFENYEVFRLADAWLRREFIPSLAATTRIVLSSRDAPTAGWLSDTAWQQHFVAIPLQDPADAGPEETTAIILREVLDPVLRRTLDAVSVVRRITRPMLAALCPAESAEELYEKLAGLSFVASRRDGLALADVVQQVLGNRLQAADPERYRQLQRSAWQLLREQLKQTTRADLWRTTADIIFLLKNPVVREAFFPSKSAQFSVEPAASADYRDIMANVERHESKGALEAMQLWWKHLPIAFHIVKDAAGRSVGFYCMARPKDLDASWMRFDPIAHNWQQHLDRSAGADNPPALFLRRWLSFEDGESPCQIQAATWIDIKRTYLELRPALRRVYLTLQDIGPYAAVATELGFAVIEDITTTLTSTPYYTAMLDFGPGSVDGWICNLLAAELGVTDDRLLDTTTRELVLDGQRVALTPLEFGVIAMLDSRAGEAVSRTELLQQVWGHGYDGGSNVVDAIVHGLRKKCGSRARIFETVRGVGYRLQA
ncbi:MAG: winged helix-turn-helix domain-containing protein [Proteobacteria bacterium]|nr:winged helix-turn-helix domain-containing protein [Pseudomonadota bacterium]